MLKKLFKISLALIVLITIIGSVLALYLYNYYSRDLPNFANIDDYRPEIISAVYSVDGTLVAEFYNELRYPVKLKDVPKLVQNAFIAAEDAAFYTHKGIDFVSIIRATIKNFVSGKVSQGASTITQQVIKNLLLGRERKLERKIKEAILAYRLEAKLTKDEILEIYLNQIFFGNGAYGVKAAAKAYFHKNLEELTLAEASILAGLPKAPSKYSPSRDFSQAKIRQNYVLREMQQAGMITKLELQAADLEEVKVYQNNQQKIFKAPYYVSEVRRIFINKFKGRDIDRDGYRIETVLNLDAYDYAEKALQNGLKDLDKRRGWRGPIQVLSGDNLSKQFNEKFTSIDKDDFKIDKIYPALVTKVDKNSGAINLNIGNFNTSINIKNAAWAKKILKPNDSYEFLSPERLLVTGDIIEVSFTLDQGQKLIANLDQTPEVEGAVVLLDPNSGKVITVIGGYDYGRNVFNLATQGKRQPGSAFKPVVFLTAIADLQYTVSTIVIDEPKFFRVGNTIWNPANYDEGYLGPITLRVALEKSRNMISADLISKTGVKPVIDYAKRLGIESELGENLSLSLGSSEVTPLELTRAYGVFAAKGILNPSVFISKVYDRDDKLIYDYTQDPLIKPYSAISEQAAFIMADLMKGVVESGTGWKVKALKRPVAGKTGTSNDAMDTWFLGFTPEWSAGIWVGFDKFKKSLGPKETGGMVAAPIWLNLMQDFLLKQDELKGINIKELYANKNQNLDFIAPETGLEVYNNVDGRPEYYLAGTKPGQNSYSGTNTVDYWDSSDL